MKKVTAIVRPSKLEDLKEALFEANVKGMTISQVQGCGSQHGWTEVVRGREIPVNTIPKVKFELICSDNQVESIIGTICVAAYTGEVGDGKIFVTPIEDAIRIRTRERGDVAI